LSNIQSGSSCKRSQIPSVLMTHVITGPEFASPSPLDHLTQNGPNHSLYTVVALGSQSKPTREARRMQAVANSAFLLLGLVFFAFWISVNFMRRLPRQLIFCLGGLGIFALTFSALSPNDDLLQRDLIHPAARSVNVARHVRAFQR